MTSPEKEVTLCDMCIILLYYIIQASKSNWIHVVTAYNVLLSHVVVISSVTVFTCVCDIYIMYSPMFKKSRHCKRHISAWPDSFTIALWSFPSRLTSPRGRGSKLCASHYLFPVWFFIPASPLIFLCPLHWSFQASCSSYFLSMSLFYGH